MARSFGRTWRQFSREMTARDIAEEMALDLVEDEIAREAKQRAELEAKALEGLKARMDKRPKRR